MVDRLRQPRFRRRAGRLTVCPRRRMRHALGRLVLTIACAVGLISAGAVAGCASSAVLPGKITVGFSAWPGWFPWQVAQEQGLFASNGLKVELKYFDSYTESIKALTD